MKTTREIQTARQFLFLQRWTMAREWLLSAIAGLSQTVICKESVIGDWTVKDILGHVMTWNDEVRGQIQVILKKEDSSYSQFISTEKDFADWNQPRIAKKRK